MPGSSPLARGLLVDDDPVGQGGGIIPARAGFTLNRQPRGPIRGDHPRSRGVYPVTPHGAGGVPGSSPLARGLLAQPPHRLGDRRIIPARAGFTRPARRPPGAGPDHPRSRGVYSPADLAAWAPAGSSPLARGLPPARRARGGRRGIIPARAGFTASTSPSRGRAPDHPRSRGVYAIMDCQARKGRGSSPLARGLRW